MSKALSQLYKLPNNNGRA